MRIEIPGRFVGKQDRGVGNKGPGNGNALHLAAGELFRTVFGPVTQPDLLAAARGPSA